MLCAECGLPVDPRTGHCSTCGVWSLDDTAMPQASHAGARGSTPGAPWGAPQQPSYATPPPGYDVPPSYATAAPPTPPTPAASSTYWPPPRASERADLPAPPEELFPQEPYIIPPPAASAPSAPTAPAAPAASPTAAPAAPAYSAPTPPPSFSVPTPPPTFSAPTPPPAYSQPAPSAFSAPTPPAEPAPSVFDLPPSFAARPPVAEPPPASQPSASQPFSGQPSGAQPFSGQPFGDQQFPVQMPPDPFASFADSVDPSLDDLDATMVVPRRGSKTTSWSLSLPSGGVEVVQGSVIVGRAASPLPTRPGARLLSIDDLTRSISKNHAVFTDENGYLFIEDLDSMNGIVVTRADGHVTDLIPGERLRLDHGSRVELGDVQLMIHRN